MTGKILRGPQRATGEPTMGLGEYFFETAEKYGDKVFQIDLDKGVTETFTETKKRAVKIALYLQKIGIKPGDVVMSLCKNGVDNVAPVLAAVFLGAPVSSLDLKLDLFDIKHSIDLVKPKIIFVVEERIELIEKALKELEFNTKIVAIGGNSSKYPNMYDIEKEKFEGENSFKPFTVADVKKEVGFILFSSGTTSFPKAVMWSHFTVLYESLREKSSQAAASVQTAGVFHSQGLYFNRLLQATASCMVNCIPRITLSVTAPDDIYMEAVSKYQIDTLFFSATRIHKLMALPKQIFAKYDLSSVKRIAVLGSPVDSETILKLRQMIPNAKVLKGYGSTEIGTASFLWTPEAASGKFYDTKPDSSGTIMENIEVKVVDVNTGELLGPNQEGEILIKAPSQMLGFYNSPISPQIYDEDGFYKTGDLGYYDEDEYLYIVDRITDIYKYRSLSISPLIIETVLLKHPAIKEVVVVGIPDKADEYHGAACIVLNKGYEISVEEIDKYITENLGDLYRLRGGVKFLEAIPKTPSEKLQKRTIRQLFLNKI